MSEQVRFYTAAFAPFFIGAAAVAVFSICAWVLVYLGLFAAPSATISPFQWHAHQMIHGYAMAVIAGFLLTMIQSWTGQVVARGTLFALLLLWLLARVFFFAGELRLAALLDLIFVGWLAVTLTLPIVRTQQWRQMAVVSKLMLLGIANLCFYLGALGLLGTGVYWGIYGGLYLVLTLILTMGRRLFPAFVEAEAETSLFNSRWLDGTSLLLFLAFFVSELAARSPQLSAWLALGLAVVNGTRLVMWHRPVIWKNNLLWSFYLALWMIVLGFVMFAASWTLGWPVSLAIHAMAFGGIGLVTLSMMWRVLLDHTGMQDSAAGLRGGAFSILVAGSLLRVVLPLLWPGEYRLWISLSSLCWALAFTLFISVAVKTALHWRPQQSTANYGS